ncbi:Glycosyl transferase family 2 [Arthrobacter sp. ok909]|nr:Glycosyl transferase family 2 [Arthrobacter sp. ok909]
MRHTVLTMSRGDSPRLREWVEYHSRLGFDDFYIILDNPVDDSEQVLLSLDVPAKITIDVRAASGDYYDGLTPAERWARVLAWRKANESRLTALGLPVVDPLALRQLEYFREVLSTVYAGNGDSWVAVIDLDEFIALPGGRRIQDITSAARSPRVRFLNFNFDTSGNDDTRPFLAQHTMRWAREDVEAYGQGWEHRVKTIARNDALLPFTSVHPISKGPCEISDPDVARLHHYKIPDQGLPIPYSTKDTTLIDTL